MICVDRNTYLDTHFYVWPYWLLNVLMTRTISAIDPSTFKNLSLIKRNYINSNDLNESDCGNTYSSESVWQYIINLSLIKKMFSSNQVKCNSLFIILIALVKLERLLAHLFTWAQVIKMDTQSLYRKSIPSIVSWENIRKTNIKASESVT